MMEGAMKTAVLLLSFTAVTSLVLDHTKYHSYDDLADNLVTLVDHYNETVRGYTLIRPTHEDRRVYLVQLTNDTSQLPDNNSTDNRKKPLIMIEAGQHGNEWLSPAATMYFMDKLLEEFHKAGSGYKNVLMDYDWLINPLVNPDGYEFTRSDPDNRGWRKNRRPIDDFGPTNCTGVDLNQNFYSEFGPFRDVIYHDCAHQEFEGLETISERETKNTVDVFWFNKKRVVAYVSVHGYGRDIGVAPSSLEREDIEWPKFPVYIKLNNALNDTIRVAQQGMRCEIESESDLSFEAGLSIELPHKKPNSWATATDYVLAVKPELYALEVSLGPQRAAGKYLYDVDASHIVPHGDALFHAMVALAEDMDTDRVDRLVTNKKNHRKEKPNENKKEKKGDKDKDHIDKLVNNKKENKTDNKDKKKE